MKKTEETTFIRAHHTVRFRHAHSGGNRLWWYRKKLGYSQKGVALLLGHQSSARVCDYERGNQMPSLETALKLSIILQTPIVTLYPQRYAQLEQGIKQREGKLKRSARSAEARQDVTGADESSSL